MVSATRASVSHGCMQPAFLSGTLPGWQGGPCLHPCLRTLNVRQLDRQLGRHGRVLALRAKRAAGEPALRQGGVLADRGGGSEAEGGCSQAAGGCPEAAGGC